MSEARERRDDALRRQRLRELLPFLPGNSVNGALPFSGPDVLRGGDLNEPRFHKSHHFDKANTVSVVMENVAGIGGAPLPGQAANEDSHAATSLQHGNAADPSWVVYDRAVLRFHAYFKEAVEERREERFRVRLVHILVYLEDESVQISEPRIQNSGMPLGMLLRRHRVPVDSNASGSVSKQKFLSVNDFNVSKSVSMYGRTFRIYSCDDFTRSFLTESGRTVPPAEEVPEDPYTLHRQELSCRMRATRPSEGPKGGLRQFLDNDRRVLRFFCYWDDSQSAFGDVRKMVLHYFLADDTIELVEQVPPNSGRDSTAFFLTRGRLPKKRRGSDQGGATFSGADFYSELDLSVGANLELYGRVFHVYDCDDFTRQYYKEKYNQDFEVESVPTTE